jgi:hypothetical protein
VSNTIGVASIPQFITRETTFEAIGSKSIVRVTQDAMRTLHPAQGASPVNRTSNLLLSKFSIILLFHQT